MLFYAPLALFSISASTATAQSGGTLAQRLDGIAGAGVRENLAVGITAAVVRARLEVQQPPRDVIVEAELHFLATAMELK